jgi:hypothetical protein
MALARRKFMDWLELEALDLISLTDASAAA